jgi:hypothetical protein
MEASMEIRVDSDVQSVLEFMQRSVPASKLVSVAENTLQMGRLLWSKFPQEPSVGFSLEELPITNGLLPVSSESGLVTECAGDDSVVEVYAH